MIQFTNVMFTNVIPHGGNVGVQPVILVLLKRCGLLQQDIADRLQVPKSAVSMWSTGSRPIPVTHRSRLWNLFNEALETAQAKARAKDAVEPGKTLLTADRHTTELQLDIERLLHDANWQEAEIEHHGLTMALITTCSTLARYAEAEPESLSLKPVDLDQIETATKRLRAIVATFRRLSDSDSHVVEEEKPK
jgi:hypothetical protein